MDEKTKQIIEDNINNITVSIEMTIPTDVQYENFRVRAEMNIKKVENVDSKDLYNYAWKKVQNEIFIKYNQIKKNN